MFLKRTLLPLSVLFSLSLLIGCSGGDTETSAPEGGGVVEELVDEGEEVVEEAEAALAGSQLDLTYVTDDFSSAVIVHPARMLDSEFMSELVKAGLPLDEAMQEPIEQLGVDPRKVDQVMVLLDNTTAAAAPEMLPFLQGPPGGQPGGFRPEELDERGEVPNEPLESPDTEEAPKDTGQGSVEDPSGNLQTVSFQPAGFEVEETDGAQQEAAFPTIIVRFSEDVDAGKFFSNPNAPPMEDAEIDGLKVKQSPFVEGVFHFATPKTLIVTKPDYLKKMIETEGADSELISELKKIDPAHDVIVVLDLTPVQPLLAFGAEMVKAQVPEDKQAVVTSLTKTKMLTLTGGVSHDSLITLSLMMASAEDAAGVNEVLTDGLKQGREMYKMQKSQGLPSDLPLDEAGQQEVIAMADEIVDGITNETDGNRLTISIPKPANFNKLAALLKPAIEDAKQAAERSHRINNLKQVGLAFHNYHAVHNSFPGAGSDATGEKKGLSWRVHLLPYLDQAPLYDQFNLDEPWDSDHNKALISQMPEIYMTEGVADPTKTSLHLFVGQNAYSEEGGTKIAQIIDGTSNSILVVEAGADKADVWTKPGGLTLNADDPLSSLGELTRDYFLALFADGSVHTIDTSVDPETLKGLITINGGEVPGDF